MTSPQLFTSALLVEDEVNLAATLKIALRKLSIPVRHAATLQDARDRIAESQPDFILLDRNLPDGDGLELCSDLRKQGYTGMILILTASGQTSDKIAGLTQGADDYLPKPCDWEELNARIVALSRRVSSPAPEGGAAAPTRASKPLSRWIRDEDRLRIQGPKGVWVELTPLEFKLASHLMIARGAIVGREELLKHVWGFTLLPKTRTVDHFLGRLRKRFEVDAENPKHFITVRGAGYRFEE